MDTTTRYDQSERSRGAGTVQDSGAQTRGRATRSLKPRAPVLNVEFGSGWYHADAIKDAQESHAHPYR